MILGCPVPREINKRLAEVQSAAGYNNVLILWRVTGQGHASDALPVSHTAAPHGSGPAAHPVLPALEGHRQCDSL